MMPGTSRPSLRRSSAEPGLRPEGAVAIISLRSHRLVILSFEFKRIYIR